MRLCLPFLALLAGSAASSAQEPLPAFPDEEEPIIVTGHKPPITVTAPPRCRRRSGDPLDAVAVKPGRTGQSVIIATQGGGVVRPDHDPVLGPGVWQRAGNAIADYVFRVPEDGGLLCIGAAAEEPAGWGQLRQVVDIKRYRGRYVRLTAYVATRAAREVRFWLAAADHRRVYNGGDTSRDPIQGTKGWTPVSLVIGPVSAEADHISYGFLLYGAGDVWVTRLTVEPIAGEDARRRAGFDLGGNGDRLKRAPFKGDRRDLDRKLLENPPE